MSKTAAVFLVFFTLVGCDHFVTRLPDGGPPPDAEPLVYPYDVRVACSPPVPIVQLPGDPVAIDWSVTNVGTEGIESASVAIEVEWTSGVWTEEASTDVGPLLVGDAETGRLLMIVPSGVAPPDDATEHYAVRCSVETTPTDQRPDNNVSTESEGVPLRLGVHSGF